MTRALCLLLCLFAHGHSRPHVCVRIVADRPIQVTTFAVTGQGPDVFTTWTMDPDASGLVILRPCGEALRVEATTPGDFDGDGDLDLRDLAILFPVMTGPT